MDTAVLIIFFNRPGTLKKVFERVRLAQPKKLFLAQDGPRSNKPEDVENVLACREIVNAVDWPCDVTHNYSETNLGCGMRPQSAITWAFSQVDELIILEDDCVPHMDFFPYCEALLERYRDDTRICYISGLNHFETWDCGEYSYCYTEYGSIWGWATWKRSWLMFDYNVKLSQNTYIMRKLRERFGQTARFFHTTEAWNRAYQCQSTKKKLSYWDMQWGFVKYTQHQLVIVPACNLICNIGDGKESTHAKDVHVSSGKHKGFTALYLPTHPVTFPLSHPPVMLHDVAYDHTLDDKQKGNLVARSKSALYRFGRSRGWLKPKT